MSTRDPGVSPAPKPGSFAARLDPRANSLNLVRLVLAAMVIVSHSWSVGGYGHEPLHGGLTPGGWAVDAFFGLSGYLITGSRATHSFVTFLRFRVLRIYPGFLVCLLMTAMVWAPYGYYHLHHTTAGYTSTGNSPVRFVLSDLGLKMTTWKVAGTPIGSHSWNGSLWSLFYEFLCYLLVGVLASLAIYRKRPIVCAILLTGITVANIQHLGSSSALQWAGMYQLVRLVPFFLAGSLVYLLRAKLPCRWPLAVLSAAFLWIFPISVGQRWVVLCALPLAYLLLYLGAVVPITFARKNDISYGVYMYGYPVEQMVRLAGIGSQTLYTVFAILGTIPVAAGSWFLVERPMMRWGRKLGTKHRGRHRASRSGRVARPRRPAPSSAAARVPATVDLTGTPKPPAGDRGEAPVPVAVGVGA